MCNFGLLVVTSICFFILGDASLTVKNISNGVIETYVELVKLQGIPFNKRVVNQTTPTSVDFAISDEKEIGKLNFLWILNDAELQVPHFRGHVPDKPGNVFSTEITSDNEMNLTLHLRNKGLLAGNYTLVVSRADGLPVSASGFVKAAPVLPLFPKDRRVLDGDRLNLFCEVSAYPKPSEVQWHFTHIKPDLMDDSAALVDAKSSLAPLNLTSDVYTFNTKSVKNDQLVFNELTRNFNGLYQCVVTTADGNDETLILVNVKDRWAALWPFIGIVIEVTVLVIAILLYERHQMRSKASKAEVAACPVNDSSAPSAKLRTTSVQQLQQNNLSAAADPRVEVTQDGNKPSGLQSGDEKSDELRLRGTSRC